MKGLCGYVFGSLVCVTASAAVAGPSDAFAVLVTCEHSSSVGRVLCEVESEVESGRIAWADVLVTQAPDVARPLRARVGLAEASARSQRRVRIPVAFIADAVGTGEFTVRSRLVVCRRFGSGEHCVPQVVDTQSELSVGPLAW